MKKILYVLVSFVYFVLLCHSSDNIALTPKLNRNETKALNLAIELIEKLSANTTFSRKDGEKFFGDIENFYGHTVSFYYENNYVDIKTENKDGPAKVILKKDLPSLSFFGEILRIYRNIFIEEGSNPIFSVEKEYYVSSGKTIEYFNRDMVVISIRPNVNAPTQISLLYSIRHGFFLEDITINGIPLFVYLKLAGANNPNKISPEFLDLMKTHILSKQK